MKSKDFTLDRLHSCYSYVMMTKLDVSTVGMWNTANANAAGILYVVIEISESIFDSIQI